MNKISKSPQRNTFQKDSYLKRKEEDNEPVNEAYLDMWSNLEKLNAERELDPAWQQNNLEYDLRSTDWILEKVRNSDTYAQNLYAAMCNNEFQKFDIVPILKEDIWGCSWRYAGGIIADMRQEGDYINWYCSGIGEGLGNGDVDGTKGYVSESVVTEEIMEDLKRLGWIVLDEEK